MEEKYFTGMNKTRRDRRVRRFKEKHPDANLREIGEHFGASYETIRKILREANNAT